ncbi:fibrinogen alpha chain-like [Gigantopelta aegis]|uniref:fibrinogen alpha chain-like n=1 Tax=Gigantopelta aegis TaxID=1735272 RepID=UPI001B88E012|nr:fibrinogen alpha chain-like [Gigantopelta aegis]
MISMYVLVEPITDCWDVKTRQNQSSDGTYKIDSPAGGQMNVRCDMTTDNGGWLTFVRRVRGGVDFNRSWEDYKNGFGDLAGDFWLGNEFVHMFTAAKNVEMRVDLSDWKGNHAYELYDSLLVDDETNNYTIHVGNYTGDVRDSFRNAYVSLYHWVRLGSHNMFLVFVDQRRKTFWRASKHDTEFVATLPTAGQHQRQATFRSPACDVTSTGQPYSGNTSSESISGGNFDSQNHPWVESNQCQDSSQPFNQAATPSNTSYSATASPKCASSME